MFAFYVIIKYIICEIIKHLMDGFFILLGKI